VFDEILAEAASKAGGAAGIVGGVANAAQAVGSFFKGFF
jgi:hypothetical protein